MWELGQMTWTRARMLARYRHGSALQGRREIAAVLAPNLHARASVSDNLSAPMSLTEICEQIRKLALTLFSLPMHFIDVVQHADMYDDCNCAAKDMVSPAPSSGSITWSNSWQHQSGDWNSWWDNWGQGWWGHGYNYWNHYEQQQQDKKQDGGQASLVSSLLQRGQTVDQLTEEELQKVVREIDEIRKAKASNAEPAAKQLAGELAKEPKEPVQKPAATQPTCEAEPKMAPLTEEEIQEQQAQAKHERKKKCMPGTCDFIVPSPATGLHFRTTCPMSLHV